MLQDVLINLPYVKSQNGGKFQLLDEKGFIEVYVEKASSEEVSEIYHKVLQGSGVTVTGKTVAWEKETQLKCRKSVYLVIDRMDAIKL